MADTDLLEGANPLESHTCNDENTEAKVFVNGIRVPVTDVDIHMRKEGDASVTRYAEGKLISPWEGNDYVRAFEAIEEDSQSSYDTVRIDIANFAAGNFVTQFQGLVTGLGNSGGIEREWTFRAKGPGHFFNTIPVSKNFTADGNGVTDEDVLSFIKTELDKKIPFNISDAINAEIPGDNLEYGEEEGTDGPSGPLDRATNVSEDLTRGAIDLVQRGSRWTLNPLTPNPSPGEDKPEVVKSFTQNRHTLTDVLDWFQRKFNYRVYISPLQQGATIVAIRYPHLYEHSAHYMGGNLVIENNDSLSELRPVNTLVAKGDSKRSRTVAGIFEVQDDTNKYAYVKVQHKRLFERAGGTELSKKQIEVDAFDKDTVAAEAKDRLKKQIDNASGGDMQVLPRAPIAPYHLVHAKPTCRGTQATDVSPVEYEVHRVHHKIRSGDPSQTILDVGIRTSVIDDIEVAEEGWRTP